SMLPSIDHHQWDAGLCEVGLVVVNLRDQQPLSNRLPYQRSPAGSHNGRGNLRKLFTEARKVSEVFLNSLKEIAVRIASTLGRHVFPEDRMEDVPGEVESQCAFQCGYPSKIILLSRFEKLFQDRICIFHIPGVMLAMMQFHDLSGNVRFQRAV